MIPAQASANSALATARRRLIKHTPIGSYKWKHLPDGLYVFTFHRIGDATKTKYDPHVFSCDQSSFREHLAMISQKFNILRPSELFKLPDRGLHALVTFDDGYRDNLEIAAPILHELGLEAIMFVATGLVASSAIPWWDQVAFSVRHATQSSISLDGITVDIGADDINASIRNVLRAFKKSPIRLSEKLSEINQQLAPSCEPGSEQLLMNWDDLREAKSLGMTIGSHSVSHPILAHLSAKEQQAELTDSRNQLESALDAPVDFLAYPVGGADTFSGTTLRLAAEAGYKFAFTTLAGANSLQKNSPLELKRIAVSTSSPRELQSEICVSS